MFVLFFRTTLRLCGEGVNSGTPHVPSGETLRERRFRSEVESGTGDVDKKADGDLEKDGTCKPDRKLWHKLKKNCKEMSERR